MGNLKQNLGLQIQKLRKIRGITQEQLAERINMDPANVSNIERGKRFMTAETLEKIADVLNVSVNELFSFDEYSSREYIEKYLTKEIKLLNDAELNYLYKTVEVLKKLR